MKGIILLLFCSSAFAAPTAVEFGDSRDIVYTLYAGNDLCGLVNLKHDPFENVGNVCQELTPYAVNLLLNEEQNNGCAQTELIGMQKEFSVKAHFHIVIFNAGLHDFQTYLSGFGCGLSTQTEFYSNVEAVAIEAQDHGDICLWVDATPVPTGQTNIPPGIETTINPIGEAIAIEHGCYILNWVNPSFGQIPNNVHYTPEGYAALGQQLADCVSLVESGMESLTCHH